MTNAAINQTAVKRLVELEKAGVPLTMAQRELVLELVELAAHRIMAAPSTWEATIGEAERIGQALAAGTYHAAYEHREADSE